MRCGYGVMVLLLLTIALSGCTGTGDRPLDPADGAQEGVDPTENETDPSDGQPRPWIHRFDHEGSVDAHLCIDVIACTVFTEGDPMVQLSFDNATIVRLDLVVEWDEENGSGQGRVLTVECWNQEDGVCTDLMRTRGSSPLELNRDALHVPPGALLNVTVSLPNQSPEPVILMHDEVVDFILTGELLLEPIPVEDREQGD